MPWAAGSFSRSNGTHTGSTTWAQDRDLGTKITAANHDTHDQDLSDGINSAINKDGSNSMTGDFNAGSNKVTSVASGTLRSDAPNVGQVQDGAFTWGGTAGGTADALTLTPSPAITSYTAGARFAFISGASPNTGATTLAVSGLSNKGVQLSGAALNAGDIAASTLYHVIFDGAAFQLFAAVDLATHMSDTTTHGTTGAIVGISDSQTLTNKTVDLTDNTVTGTTAQFNTALSDGSFATLAGSETLTNKVLTSPDINTPDIDGGTVDSTTINGSAIGGTTPAAGNFTTITASSTIKATNIISGQSTIRAGHDGTSPVAGEDFVYAYGTDSDDYTYIAGRDAADTDSILRSAVGGTTNVNITAAGDISTIKDITSSGDIKLSSGGLYVGGVVAANYLDDYEEGTFTPTYLVAGSEPGSVAYNTSFTAGSYTKVGNLVTFSFTLRLTARGTTGTSAVTFGGLPFTSNSAAGTGRAACSVYIHEGIDTTGNLNGTFQTFITGNVDYISMEAFDLSSDTAESIQVDDTTDTLYIQVTGHYRV